MAEEKEGRYLDENLSDEEKESGRLRQPGPDDQSPTEQSERSGRKPMNPDRPDEFGDGDRRS